MYTDLSINSTNLHDFDDHIPVNYHSQIEAGEIIAKAIYETSGGKVVLLGVILTADHAGWLEVIWISMEGKDPLIIKASDILRYRLTKAMRSGKYRGAFCELHAGEETKVDLNILSLAGFSVTETNNNIYEITLKDITGTERIEEIAKQIPWVSVAKATQEELFEIEEMMNEDERPVPVPYEIDWENCERDLSIICIEKMKPVGLLYFVKEKDTLVLELAYSKSQTGFPGMLGAAYGIAKEKYGDSQKILIPIIEKGTEGIVTKLVPGAKRGRVYEAVMWFDKPDIPPAMELMIKQAVKE